MANKNIYSRMQQKHDTEANWNKAVNFIPMKGELIVYDIDENYNYERIKVGDGVTVVTNLPFYLMDEIETILNHVDDVTSDIQTQLNNKMSNGAEINGGTW